ncbi:hypothetical protein HUT18_04240 [Streptomyces sp. NA04227]|uniref:DUF5685 family protein n=1 Tax=Streptomyces sp. NA04227 TaxID=2742136 RepID=UPI001590FD98|nr:DUF5685 family protein [Streptomyces sp. NA04227]QKW05707.1 hypothetical protein HUT18_04240 [Streptomyces sp. NA04227]
MFGIVRPCSHRLGGGLKSEWMAHLCGLCLALRSDHGQFARVVTNYDGLLISVLTEAQSGSVEDGRRTAGPCPLRGMRTASVARGEGARLAAAVSLVLASAKMRDHLTDGDGVLARRPLAVAARKVASGWDRAGRRTGADVGFDTAVLLDAVDRQPRIEALAGPGTPLLTVTEPTETATAAAFAYTATLAGRPDNAAPLAEAGRLFGRLAHLLDAVEDRESDAAAGAWNPLTATGTSRAEARRLADDALHGIRLALRETEFVRGKLVHVLLVHELRRSVDRAFGTASCGHGPGAAASGTALSGGTAPLGSYGPAAYGSSQPMMPGAAPGTEWSQPVDNYGNPLITPPAPGGPAGPGGPDDGGWGGGGGGSRPPHRPRRGLLAGCAVALGLFCTCQVCCSDEYEDPWSRQPRQGCCNNCDCGDCGSCGECCECCECCDCGC